MPAAAQCSFRETIPSRAAENLIPARLPMLFRHRPETFWLRPVSFSGPPFLCAFSLRLSGPFSLPPPPSTRALPREHLTSPRALLQISGGHKHLALPSAIPQNPFCRLHRTFPIRELSGFHRVSPPRLQP